MKTTVIIPTYNERENLISLILALPHDLRLIVVDDGSPDGTGRVADQVAAQEARLTVVHREGKLGLGTAYLAGFRCALAGGATHMMTMDADFSHHPRYIPDLLRLGERYDLVIGSRYVPGGGTRHWHWQRVLLSWSANQVAKHGLGLRPRDCTAGFRLYRRAVLESIDLESIFSDGYSFLLEMLYHVQHGHWQIGETPILFADRQRGASKISKQEIVKAAYTVLRLRAMGAGRRLAG